MRLHPRLATSGSVAALVLAAAALGPVAPAQAADGSCLTSGRVLLAVDGLGTACVSPGSGDAMLAEAGWSVRHAPNGMICQIGGVPNRNNCTYTNNGWNAATQEYLVFWHWYPCENFPNGYAYGNVSTACNTWNYSDLGATSYAAPAGSIDLWQYGTTDTAPRLAIPAIPAARQPAPTQPAPTTDAAAPAPAPTTASGSQGGGTTGDQAAAPADTQAGAGTQEGAAAPAPQGQAPAGAQATADTEGTSAPAGAESTASAEATPSAATDATPSPGAASASASPATPATPGATSSAAGATASRTPAVAPASAGAGTSEGSPTGLLVSLGLVAALAGGGAAWWRWGRTHHTA